MALHSWNVGEGMQNSGTGKINQKLEQKSMVHYCKYPLLTYDLNLGVKVTQNVAQYLQHNMTYAPVKVEDANSNG